MSLQINANWRTSVSGYVETVCAIVILLCALPSEIWTNPRVWIPASLLIIAKTIKDSLTKDRSVTGGTIQQDAQGNVAKPQEPTPEPPSPALPETPLTPAVAVVKRVVKLKSKRIK